MQSDSSTIDGLIRPWPFALGHVPVWLRARRAVRSAIWKRSPPQHVVIKSASQFDRWCCLFAFLPDGVLSPAHRFTIERLKAINVPLLVVCATPHVSDVPRELKEQCDSLIWKSLSGYDFSAYAIALWHLATASPGATALVMNDSVLGPFTDIGPLLADPPWDVTGFTASSLVQNHIQSYAFILRDVRVERLQRLKTVLPIDFAYNRAGEVILCQELTLAATASRSMSCGALWYGESGRVDDPTLQRTLELLDSGFPFLKKSVFGKQMEFQAGRHGTLQSFLAKANHPQVAATAASTAAA